MPNQITVKERLGQLPPPYREYVIGGMPQVIVEAFAEAHSLTEEQRIILGNGFVLYLIFFISQRGLADFIEKEGSLDNSTAATLASAMPLGLPEEIQRLHKQTSNLVFPENYSPENETSMMAEIAETEAALETISPIRTMARDSQQTHPSAENTYTSMQSAILEEGK